MTEITAKPMDSGQSDEASPSGTAIVRPLRHVRAVRERYMLRFTDPAQAAASRSARAWAWALGETALAPVTDQETDAPPSRTQIQVEIAIADDRRLRGERENRADAAATILRWLIGEDDCLPIRGDNLGELVGGFGDFVRSRDEIAARLADAMDVVATPRQAVARGMDLEARPHDLRRGQDDAEYFGGVAATLAWILGQRPEAPISRRSYERITRGDVKAERIHVEDVIDQAGSPWMRERLPPLLYARGVKDTIAWLLGDATEGSS